jgi:hypothetical protein
MNELAREALVTAALTGVRQIKGLFKDADGGMCAMQVIHEAYKNIDPHYQVLPNTWISLEECWQVLNANDNLGWDFLTIARKIGVQDNGVNITQEDTK